ncbi:tetraacyldisaccharide 4'-kinase [Aurantimonas sp. VKM B-3413]|uniref:tetraacyldisaccharide 4'-kinase n=1 Tax=Aurantimonas sp. VKM B-3413 TaxID=2779401 RepID=UPI00351D2F2A
MMGREAPDFWWRESSWPARLLSPAAALYGRAARRNLDRGARAEIAAPVLCIGNFTVGGGGKTPTALALGEAARASGLTPGFVSRGHGRSRSEVLIIDPERHGPAEAGDEPLLLAAVAPTAVAVDRRRAAERLIAERGCDFVIMDDGFQSMRLRIDFALVTLDARRGIGNGRVLPAGPLRAPILDQIRHADALLVIGTGSAGDAAIRQTARAGKPIFEARFEPVDAGRFAGLRVLAFAGIADPEKFYDTLREAGAEIAATREFPDHHMFSREDMHDLSAAAWRDGLQLVTTAKDAARLTGGGEAAELFLKECDILAGRIAFSPESAGRRIIAETIAAYRRRTLG